LNTHVLLYCAAIVILTTLIFSTVPSLQSKTVPLTAGLRKEPVGSGYFGITRRLPMWFTRFFVVLQIGLSFVLLAEGAVFLRSLTEIDQTNVGFDKENTISVWFDSAAAGYTPEQMPSLYNRLSDALKNVPGLILLPGLTVISIAAVGIQVSSTLSQPPQLRERLKKPRKTGSA
jgi:putative ABC transport system permease protein